MFAYNINLARDYFYFAFLLFGFGAGYLTSAFITVGITRKKRSKRITNCVWLLCAIIFFISFAFVYSHGRELLSKAYLIYALIILAISFCFALYPGISSVVILPVITVLIFCVSFFFLRYPAAVENDPSLNDRRIKYTASLDYGGVILQTKKEVPLIGGKTRFILTELYSFSPASVEIREIKRTGVATNTALQMMAYGIFSVFFLDEDVASPNLLSHKKLAELRAKEIEERSFSYSGDIDDETIPSWRIRRQRVSFQSIIKTIIMNVWQAVYNLIQRL